MDVVNPSRPKLITALAVMQCLVAGVYLFGTIKIISILFSDETKKGYDPAAAANGLMIGAAACVVLMILSAVSARGLWKMKNWARWLALASNGFIALTLIYSNFDDYRNHAIDREDLIATCLFIIPVVPFLLPVVGRAIKIKQNVISI